MEPANSQAKKVQRELERLGCESRVIELSGSARSVEEAARSVGCEPGQVVKSMILRGERSGRSVPVAASGPNRVDEAKVGEILGEPVGRASAESCARRASSPSVACRLSPTARRHWRWWTSICWSTRRFGPPPGRTTPSLGCRRENW